MATTTTRLGLRKPAGTDLITVGTDLDANFDIIDNAALVTMVNSFVAGQVFDLFSVVGSKVISFRAGIPDGSNMGLRSKDYNGDGNFDGLELLGNDGVGLSTAAGNVLRVTQSGQLSFPAMAGTYLVATVGAAGGAAALPATPVGYMIVNILGTDRKFPYYNT